MNRLLGFMWAVIAIALLFWASGCGPLLYSQSAPPPGRTAALDENDGHYDLDISQGVAIAIACEHDGPCKDVVVTTENEAIADVKGASFSKLEKSAYTMYASTPAGIVIVGKSPGKTRVKVKTNDGTKTVNVHVLAPPLAGEPSKIAR
ncbi:MAG: hypothetical protein M4D80_07135 [Myxococcota bacterium]|nr:hypothetical protein [Deltaproteobacteria bacterium]MDQ3334916.1 hypothetical protein [Myxococcota bacterium]